MKKEEEEHPSECLEARNRYICSLLHVPTGGITPGSTHYSNNSSVAIGANALAQLRAESVVSPAISPEGSLSQEPPPMHASTPFALMTGSNTVHPSTRDAADSTALSLALEDMERRVLGQLEDEHILSARGPRGQRIANDVLSPPLPPIESAAPVLVHPHMHATHGSHASARSSVHAPPSMHSTLASQPEVRKGGSVNMDGRGSAASSAAVLRTASHALVTGSSGHHTIESALMTAGATLHTLRICTYQMPHLLIADYLHMHDTVVQVIAFLQTVNTCPFRSTTCAA